MDVCPGPAASLSPLYNPAGENSIFIMKGNAPPLGVTTSPHFLTKGASEKWTCPLILFSLDLFLPWCCPQRWSINVHSSKKYFYPEPQSQVETETTCKRGMKIPSSGPEMLRCATAPPTGKKRKLLIRQKEKRGTRNNPNLWVVPAEQHKQK